MMTSHPQSQPPLFPNASAPPASPALPPAGRAWSVARRTRSASTLPDAPPLDTGFELGWDHAHHGVVPSAAHLHPASPVHQGWAAGCHTFGRRTLAADRFVRKWLLLRLNAWQRGRVFEGTRVNPSFLRRIDVATCPITGETLSHGTGTLSDASVDRVCNDAGYAAGNLAVMSARANRAKNDHGPADAMAFVGRIEAGELAGGLVGEAPDAADAAREIAGLGAAHWARIAVLASFATPLPHAQAATLPLLVLPPPRLAVVNPVQALQVMLSLQFLRSGHSRRCAALASLMPDADARSAFRVFMFTLLARHLAAGKTGGRCAGLDAERRAIEVRWLDPLVQRRWQRLSLRLGAADCERIGRIAAARGLAGPGVQWLSDEAATEGWALASRGYVTAEPAAAEPATSVSGPSPAPIQTLSIDRSNASRSPCPGPMPSPCAAALACDTMP